MYGLCVRVPVKVTVAGISCGLSSTDIVHCGMIKHDALHSADPPGPSSHCSAHSMSESPHIGSLVCTSGALHEPVREL